MKTCPCNIQRFFTAVKMKIFIYIKKKMSFLIFAENIDCGYVLFALSLPHNNLCYMPLPPFQKWTRPGAQHSMAKTANR